MKAMLCSTTNGNLIHLVLTILPYPHFKSWQLVPVKIKGNYSSYHYYMTLHQPVFGRWLIVSVNHIIKP